MIFFRGNSPNQVVGVGSQEVDEKLFCIALEILFLMVKEWQAFRNSGQTSEKGG